MRITSERFKNETYRCHKCDKDIKEEEVNRLTWECDVCNNKILINIGIKNDCELVRLPPAEVTMRDDVYLQHDEEFRGLKKIAFEDGVYKFNVVGFRMVKVDVNEFVNCRW